MPDVYHRTVFAPEMARQLLEAGEWALGEHGRAAVVSYVDLWSRPYDWRTTQ